MKTVALIVTENQKKNRKKEQLKLECRKFRKKMKSARGREEILNEII
jgi:hypothetical protein